MHDPPSFEMTSAESVHINQPLLEDHPSFKATSVPEELGSGLKQGFPNTNQFTVT